MMRIASTALFLACSWLWCLGGFFPVLLIHDFGHEAFAAFLVFNVVGAVAFGFVWNDERREAFRQRHQQALQAFSAVVAGYHFIFMVWLGILLGSALAPLAFLACIAAFWSLRRHLFPVAVGLFALTLILFAIATSGPLPEARLAISTASAAHVILPMALGFGLAPYFDLTFHRAFARSARPKLSFALGLGLAFGVLLLCVYMSAGSLGLLLERPDVAPLSLKLLVGMLVVQTGFTAAAHLHEIAELRTMPRGATVLAASTLAVLVILHLVIEAFAPAQSVTVGTLIYRSFIFVIGGLFPLLILFRWETRYVIAGAAILGPCYGLGFLIGSAFAPFLSAGMAGLALLLLAQARTHARNPMKA